MFIKYCSLTIFQWLGTNSRKSVNYFARDRSKSSKYIFPAPILAGRNHKLLIIICYERIFFKIKFKSKK